MARNRKISILGVGNVGATIAYTLTLDGLCSEIALIDINKEKAEGEAIDIRQGLAFAPAVNIYAGTYDDVVDSDIIIVTIGAARKPGQSRLDLAKGNVDLIKSVMPKVAKSAPGALYIVVSNPVDILTYTILKHTNLHKSQVVGTGTILDSTRLRSILAERVGIVAQNVHAYVFGEHGDTSVIPWSIATISSMPIFSYCERFDKNEFCSPENLAAIEKEVRTSGGRVIKLKHATYYAIAMSVRYLCECFLRNSSCVITVSALLQGQYGLEDVCLSLPFIIDSKGVRGSLDPPLLEGEKQALCHSAETLKETINSIII